MRLGRNRSTYRALGIRLEHYVSGDWSGTLDLWWWYVELFDPYHFGMAQLPRREVRKAQGALGRRLRVWLKTSVLRRFTSRTSGAKRHADR